MAWSFSSTLPWPLSIMDSKRQWSCQETAAISLLPNTGIPFQLPKGSGKIEIKHFHSKRKFRKSYCWFRYLLWSMLGYDYSSPVVLRVGWACYLKNRALVFTFNVAIISNCLRLKSQKKSQLLLSFSWWDHKKNFQGLFKTIWSPQFFFLIEVELVYTFI